MDGLISSDRCDITSGLIISSLDELLVREKGAFPSLAQRDLFHIVKCDHVTIRITITCIPLKLIVPWPPQGM